MKNRIDEAAEVIAKHTEVLGASRMRQYDKALRAVRALDDDGHLLPDLPEPDNTYPEWQVGNQSIVKGIHAGAVGLEWEDREDTGRGTVTRTLYLTSEQVQAIIAAHYDRKDQ